MNMWDFSKRAHWSNKIGSCFAGHLIPGIVTPLRDQRCEEALNVHYGVDEPSSTVGKVYGWTEGWNLGNMGGK